MIRLKNVSKRFSANDALKNINLHIHENSIVGLIGRNGAGKTTLLKLIAGFWRPTSGEINVLDENPYDNLFVSLNSIVIDETMTFPEILTLAEIMDIYKTFYPNWDYPFAKQLFSYFQFNDQTFYYELSKGKKSTFNALIGLSVRAPLTIFDEPTTGMDRITRQDFYDVLKEDYETNPRTILISSHHLEEIDHIIDQLILMDEGNVIFDLAIDEVEKIAFGIKGNKEAVLKLIEGKNILYEEEIENGKYVAFIKNIGEIKPLEEEGIIVSSFSASKIVNYITGRKKGAVADVFRTTNKTT